MLVIIITSDARMSIADERPVHVRPINQPHTTPHREFLEMGGWRCFETGETRDPGELRVMFSGVDVRSNSRTTASMRRGTAHGRWLSEGPHQGAPLAGCNEATRRSSSRYQNDVTTALVPTRVAGDMPFSSDGPGEDGVHLLATIREGILGGGAAEKYSWKCSAIAET